MPIQSLGQCLPSSKTASPQFVLQCMTSYSMEHPFGQFWAALSVSPPKFLHTPSLRTRSTELEQGGRENLDVVEALFSNSQNSGVFLTLV